MSITHPGCDACCPNYSDKDTVADLQIATAILDDLAKHGPIEPNETTACWFCDMGEAGYAKRGNGHHDDKCIVKAAQDFIRRYDDPAGPLKEGK